MTTLNKYLEQGNRDSILVGLESAAIDYDHAQNPHTLSGAQAALSLIFANNRPASLLDVGCGIGTWMKAALELGVEEVQGIDGVEAPAELLHVPRELIRRYDLTQHWCLNRKFEVVLCLEVAEHLDLSSAQTLISALTAHGETIYFSAACPHQPGQHHVNCQWPTYWQKMFNDRGFVCDDSIRWRTWDDERIEPWYRQNLFLARYQPKEAGCEPRLKPIVHPEILVGIMGSMRGQFEASLWTTRAKSAVRQSVPKPIWEAARWVRNCARRKDLRNPPGDRA